MNFSNIEQLKKNKIISKIDILIDRYLSDGLTINQIKKYFYKTSSLKDIMKDINKTGNELFDDFGEYKKFISLLIREVVLDRKAEIETMELQTEQNIVKKYSEYINEGMTYSNLKANDIFKDIDTADDYIDILAKFFKTQEEYIEVKNKDYSLYTISDFQTDVTKNNRVKSDVLFLTNTQMTQIKRNVIIEIINGVYEQIPSDIEFMGILVKPHTILDKDKLKEAVDSIVNKNLVSIITSVTKYDYLQQYGDGHHIWQKRK